MLLVDGFVLKSDPWIVQGIFTKRNCEKYMFLNMIFLCESLKLAIWVRLFRDLKQEELYVTEGYENLDLIR